MQDSSKQIYTEEFVDSKWKDMSAILDAAMPVTERKSNNKLIWLLSSLLLISISVASYYAYQYEHLIPSVELVKEHTIYKNIYLNQELPHPSPVSKATNSPNSSSKNITTSTYTAKDITKTIDYPTANSSLPQTRAVKVVTTTNDTNSKKKLEDLTQLSATKSLVETTEATVAIENNKELNTKTDNNLKLNAIVSAIATTDLDYTGYGIGSSIEIPLSNKLGINTGLAFNMLTSDNYFVNGFKRVEESMNTPQRPPNPNKPIEYTEELKSFKQISLPVGLNYNLSNVISLNSGVRLRYTYGAELEDIPVPTRRMPVEPQSFFNKTNVGLSAGLKYSLNNHFSILLDSEWGLGSLGNRPDYDNPSRPNHDVNLFNLTTSLTF